MLFRSLDLYLNDSDAWHMTADGTYVQRRGEGPAARAQSTLMKRWRGGLTSRGGGQAS